MYVFYFNKYKNPLSRIIISLFCLLVECVLFAMFAMLFKFKPIFVNLLIFVWKIIDLLALGALHFYSVVLGHMVYVKNLTSKVFISLDFT